MGFGVYHFEKGTCNANQIGRHIDRQESAKHTFEHSNGATMLNIDVTPGEYQNLALQDAIDKRIEEGYKGTKAIRKDAVKYLTHIMSGSHEDMKELFKNREKSERWIVANYNFLAKEYGEENIVKFVVHLDEKTPHIHAVTVPLKEGKLTAKEVTGNPIVMAQRQDRYADAMKSFNLERGLRATGVKHETARQYYGRVQDAENNKQEVLQKFDALYEKEKVGALDVVNLKSKNEQNKGYFKEFIEKAVNYSTKGEIMRNTALKNEIKQLKSDKVYAELSIVAEKIKDKVSVLDYCTKLTNEGRLTFEGKKGTEFYFRKEGQKTGSISVNTSKNVFYDHQEGNGGDLFSAIKKFENTKSFAESVMYSSEHLSNFDKTLTEKYNQKESDTQLDNNEKATITAVFDKVAHPALVSYMKERNLIESAFLKEVHWNVGEKQYFALGWKNNNGGYDLRNKAFKGKMGTNGITSGRVGKDASEVYIFEGFSDYLSYRHKYPEEEYKFIVMNSTSNVNAVIQEISRNPQISISMVLDNDEAGTIATKKIQSAYPQAVDHRAKFLDGCKDVNEKLTKGNTETKEIKKEVYNQNQFKSRYKSNDNENQFKM
jgi:hypothetical protein